MKASYLFEWCGEIIDWRYNRDDKETNPYTKKYQYHWFYQGGHCLYRYLWLQVKIVRNTHHSIIKISCLLSHGNHLNKDRRENIFIIEKHEASKRGLYGGVVAYMDFHGNLDSCIAIRTALIKDGSAYVQAGAGIVADSVPELEELETVNKAAAVIRAINLAHQMQRIKWPY